MLTTCRRLSVSHQMSVPTTAPAGMRTVVSVNTTHGGPPRTNTGLSNHRQLQVETEGVLGEMSFGKGSKGRPGGLEGSDMRKNHHSRGYTEQKHNMPSPFLSCFTWKIRICETRLSCRAVRHAQLETKQCWTILMPPMPRPPIPLGFITTGLSAIHASIPNTDMKGEFFMHSPNFPLFPVPAMLPIPPSSPPQLKTIWHVSRLVLPACQ